MRSTREGGEQKDQKSESTNNERQQEYWKRQKERQYRLRCIWKIFFFLNRRN